MEQRHRSTRLGLALLLVLLGVAAFSGINPGQAFGCTTTTNPDGSKTCTSTTYVDPCASGNGEIVDYIPNDATIIGHQITHTPACAGATIVDQSLEDNVTGYSPPAGHRAVRVKYTVTCNSPPCNGTTSSTLVVDYTQPSGGGNGGGGGGGTGSTSPPGSSAAQLPPTVKVNSKTGKGTVPVKVPLTTLNYDVAMFFVSSGFVPEVQQKSATISKKGKRVNGGTISGTVPAGQPGSLLVQLNGKGRKALRRTGKLTIQATGTVSNTAGSTPVASRLKLVAK